MKPLEGIKVIELANYVAAPAAGRLLGDFGADVIKIEPLKGDAFRTNAHIYNTPCVDDREDPTYDTSNEGKRFIALDLRLDAGKEVLWKLLEEADVFITNLRFPSLQRLGVDYESLKDRFPQLVYAHMTGYGPKGDHANDAGYDYTCFAARGGVIGNLYEKGAEGPCPSGPSFGDFQAASYLTIAIETALLGRRLSGKGDYVNVSLHATGVYNLHQLYTSAQFGDFEYPRSRKEAMTPTNNNYRTADDRWIQLCVPDYNHDFNRFVTTIGRPDLCDDPRYCEIGPLRANGMLREFTAIIEDQLASKTMREWDEIFTKADIAHECALVSDEILADPECWANNFMEHHTYPTGNTGIVFNNPIRIQSMGMPEYRPSRGVGSDTEAVMKEIGLDDAAIEKLESQGAIKRHSLTDFARD